jgi:Ni,Fe-hydrogenase I small subunit
MQQESRYSAARSGGFCSVRECAGAKKPRCNEYVLLLKKAIYVIYTRLSIGGRSAIDIAREVCANAYATIAVGTCAAFGGIPAAAVCPRRPHP